MRFLTVFAIACAPLPPTCEQPIEAGVCDAIFPSWGFDADAGRCVPFDYGGCEGNDNRFESEADCEALCG